MKKLAFFTGGLKPS